MAPGTWTTTETESGTPGLTKLDIFGTLGWTPVVGNWNGDATGTRSASIKDGAWYLDNDGSGTWNTGDRANMFGAAGWTPVIGNWNGDTTETKIGIYKDGTWYLDYNGNGVWDAGIDKAGLFRNAWLDTGSRKLELKVRKDFMSQISGGLLIR